MQEIDNLFLTRHREITEALELLGKARDLTNKAEEARRELRSILPELRADIDARASTRALEHAQQVAFFEKMRETAENISNPEIRKTAQQQAEAARTTADRQWEHISVVAEASDKAIVEILEVVTGLLDALLVEQILSPTDFALARDLIIHLMRQVASKLIPYADIADQVLTLIEIFRTNTTRQSSKVNEYLLRIKTYNAALTLWCEGTTAIVKLYRESLEVSA